MCPLPYYRLMRQSKDPRYVRLQMVRLAQQDGVKPTARMARRTVGSNRRSRSSLPSASDEPRSSSLGCVAGILARISVSPTIGQCRLIVEKRDEQFLIFAIRGATDSLFNAPCCLV